MLGSHLPVDDNIDRKASAFPSLICIGDSSMRCVFLRRENQCGNRTGKRTSAKLTALAENMGTGPNTNP